MSDHYCCKRCGLRYDDCRCPPLTLADDSRMPKGQRFIMGGMPDEDYAPRKKPPASQLRAGEEPGPQATGYGLRRAAADADMREFTERMKKEQPMPDPINTMVDLFDGGWIERYHVKGQRMVTRQSVAEHSWRIITIIFAIESRPTAGLVLAAQFHDVSERVTGDIPANVKRANPEIERVIREVSTNEEVRLGIRFALNNNEQTLLGWADRYEGAMHCLDEWEMGNRKILNTLLRYHNYCMDKKYKLEEPVQEAKRQVLMEYLDRKVRVLHSME